MDPSFELKDDQSVKVLGLHWSTTSDALGYHININQVNPTKRSILSAIARLYDPVGTLGPAIFWAKCIMQELWIEKLDWDASPSPDIINRWKNFTTSLPALSSLSLSRFIDVHSSKAIQLLGFADASKKGYAAVYLRDVVMQNEVTVYFLTCKTKVAPLKASKTDEPLTIPRLELCAALLLAQLLSHQSFWRRWSNEYLHTLQGRQKWYKQTPNLAVGDLVVINTPSRPPMSWQLGRIIQVHPGADDIVRVVTVKTQDGTLTHPVVKLVKLPVDQRP